MTKRKIEYWVIPPDANGEFVAHMEEVLETDEKACDSECPVVCMDEQPVQLIGETCVPIPATKEHPEQVDYEYEGKGTASVFMFAEPLSGFRQVTARPHRTKVDWAHEVAQLLDTRYAQAPRITLVCDNLNTHTKGAFYEAFSPEKAREYARRINVVYTRVGVVRRVRVTLQLVAQGVRVDLGQHGAGLLDKPRRAAQLAVEFGQQRPRQIAPLDPRGHRVVPPQVLEKVGFRKVGQGLVGDVGGRTGGARGKSAAVAAHFSGQALSCRPCPA